MRTTVLACLLLVSLAGCGPAAKQYELAGPIMGTSFSVTIVSAKRPDLDALGTTIRAALDTVDHSMSTYRDDSELSRFNANLSVEWQTVSPALCETVAASIAIGELTEGAFDVTVAPAVDLWGFGPDPRRNAPPGDAAIAAVRASIGFRNLEADCDAPAIRKRIPGLRVDLSGIAKGLAVDTVAGLLDAIPLADYLVEIGGEMRARGRNGDGRVWTIGIERPDPSRRAVESVVQLNEASMATSGDYRNFFEHAGKRYSHTIDPRSARPVTHDGASVTVIDASATAADALATALLVMGPDEGFMFAARHEIAAYFISRDTMTTTSRATPAFEAYLQ